MQFIDKNDRINFRLNAKQKETIRKKAESMRMSMSKYLLHLVEHGSISIIDGERLTEEVYKLNQKLNQLRKYPAIPVKDLQDVISQGIIDINKKFESEKK